MEPIQNTDVTSPVQTRLDTTQFCECNGTAETAILCACFDGETNAFAVEDLTTSVHDVALGLSTKTRTSRASLSR